ncbi:MAG: GNAT family N-acetyltransferase [Bacilli bacterium]|nr:GNAT family N-acetyltransferase [Bacilli bacterium]
MNLNFAAFPCLETSRLVLRKMSFKDATDLFEIRSNPEMIDYSDSKLDEFLEDTIKFIEIINRGIEKNKWINWGIIHKENNKLIGTINIWNFDMEEKKAEIGYGLNPKYQGKGLMSEALKEVINFGFKEIGLDSIEVWTEKRNERSIKLIEKHGFNYLKEVREMGYYKKQQFNMKVYVLNKGDSYGSSIL